MQVIYNVVLALKGFPDGTSGKEPACQCRRRKRFGFHPWVGKIPWRRARQPTPVFLPGESHGQRSLRVHPSDSVIHTPHIHTHTYVFFFQILFHPTERLLQDIEYSTVGPCLPLWSSVCFWSTTENGFSSKARAEHLLFPLVFSC